METIKLPFTGRSMEGLIEDGDCLYVEVFDPPLPLSACSPGEVVVRKTKNDWVAHRVVVSEKNVSTKGDQSLCFDHLEDAHVWGRVKEIETPKGRLTWPFESTLYSRFLAAISVHVIEKNSRLWRGPLRRALWFFGLFPRVGFYFYFRRKELLLRTPMPQLKILGERHKLETYLYPRISKADQGIVPEWKQKRIEEALRNQMILMELGEWQESFPKNVSPCLIKGVALLNRVYPDLGDRKMSDIDILVDEQEKLVLEKLFVQLGYKPITEDHGPANRCKSMWARPQLGSEIVVELHSLLYWFQDKGVKWRRVQSDIPGYTRLSQNDEIIYLSVHLVFSHNFQNLFWLVDLYEIFTQSEHQIDWEGLALRCEQLQAEKAMAAAFYALEKIFAYHPPLWPLKNRHYFIKTLISSKFLLNPYGSLVYYALLKHVLQDKFSNALKYDFFRLGIAIRRLRSRP